MIDRREVSKLDCLRSFVGLFYIAIVYVYFVCIVHMRKRHNHITYPHSGLDYLRWCIVGVGSRAVLCILGTFSCSGGLLGVSCRWLHTLASLSFVFYCLLNAFTFHAQNVLSVNCRFFVNVYLCISVNITAELSFAFLPHTVTCLVLFDTKSDD